MQKMLKKVEESKMKIAKIEAKLARSGLHDSKRVKESAKERKGIKEETSSELTADRNSTGRGCWSSRCGIRKPRSWCIIRLAA